MEQTQSIAILLSLLALAAAPGVLMWARRRDAEPQPAVGFPATPPDGCMGPQEAVAYHLYGQAVGWDPVAMADYDDSPAVQAMWLAEAGYKLDRRQGAVKRKMLRDVENLC